LNNLLIRITQDLVCIMQHILLLWLLCGLSVHCLYISDNNPTLALQIPSLNASIPTSLTGQARCYEDGHGTTKHADLNDCYLATRWILTDKNSVLPQTFGKGVAADHKVPMTWKHKSCVVYLDSKQEGMETFSLLRVAYYASELIQPCIAQKPYSPLGGAVSLDKQKFYVAVVGD